MRWLPIILLFAGCASSEEHRSDARLLAHQTLQQTVALKREVSLKIAAEERRLRMEELRESALVAAAVRNEALANPAAVNAQFLSKKLEASTDGALSKARAASAKRQAILKVQLDSLQRLEDLRAEASRLESVLLELTRTPSKSDAQAAVEFIQKVRDEYKKIEEKAEEEAEKDGGGEKP